MRPYLVLCAFTLVAALAFGQQAGPYPSIPGYGYGPFAPLVSTPMISFETISPNPVGASNATTGLVAGATNATVSEIEGSTSSSYTAAVWYQGGAPLMTPQVNLWPEPLGRGAHARRGPMEEHAMEREGQHEKRAQWAYFSGPESTTSVAGAVRGPGPGKHSYTNEDVTRQNDKNGDVKYDSKTEKIQ
ncbi:MAG: hypothetical protein WA609_02925 [Terriglobales bacterium]